MGRATTEAAQTADKYLRISIHALRGEGDLASVAYNFPPISISIHALRGEGDDGYTDYIKDSTAFQSTPSVGRATLIVSQFLFISSDFNPRPPWGGRQLIFAAVGVEHNFNPRPPWGGRPSSPGRTLLTTSGFQSTPSVGRATAVRGELW